MLAQELREKMVSGLSAAPSPLVRHEEEVPVVVLFTVDGEDVPKFAKQICRFFGEDGYHAYAVWTDGKQVLCGENCYLMEFAEKGPQWEALRDFIREELYYRCCDILLVTAEKKYKNALKAGIADVDICHEMNNIYRGEWRKISRLYRDLLEELMRA